MCRFCGNLLFENEDRGGGDDDSVRSDVSTDLEAFCRSLEVLCRSSAEAEVPLTQAEGEGMLLTYEEMADMIIIDDRFTCGSVEVARHGRMLAVSTRGAGWAGPGAGRQQTSARRQTKSERKRLKQPRFTILKDFRFDDGSV